jgi:hypothetical protein
VQRTYHLKNVRRVTRINDIGTRVSYSYVLMNNWAPIGSVVSSLQRLYCHRPKDLIRRTLILPPDVGQAPTNAPPRLQDLTRELARLGLWSESEINGSVARLKISCDTYGEFLHRSWEVGLPAVKGMQTGFRDAVQQAQRQGLSVERMVAWFEAAVFLQDNQDSLRELASLLYLYGIGHSNAGPMHYLIMESQNWTEAILHAWWCPPEAAHDLEVLADSFVHKRDLNTPGPVRARTALAELTASRPNALLEGLKSVLKKESHPDCRDILTSYYANHFERVSKPRQGEVGSVAD